MRFCIRPCTLGQRLIGMASAARRPSLPVMPR
ncbi:hypothetical protein [Mesorhizobium sp.]